MRAQLRCMALAGMTLFAVSAWAADGDVPTDNTSEFTNYVATLFRADLGDSAVVVKAPLALTLGDLQINLQRVYDFCRYNAQACPHELDRYVMSASQTIKERNAPPTREAVRLAVRSTQYLIQAQTNMAPGASPIQPRPLVEDLVVLPVLDAPRSVRMLTAKDDAALKMSADEVYALALSNTRAALKPLMEVAKPAGLSQIGQLVGDAYQSSRLALFDTWAPLAQAQGGSLIVTAPATDALFYVGEDSPDAIEALRQVAKDVMERSPSHLSEELLRWTPNGWEPVH